MSISSKRNKSLLIGLTGGIGAGKSTVAKVFSAFNIPVFNSDFEAKNVLNNDTSVIEEITRIFGDVYTDGQLNRKRLADAVFKDKTKLEMLNNIVHPKVHEAFTVWVERHENCEILIKEAAILIESGAYKQLDKIIVVTCGLENRIERIMKRDNASYQQIKDRMDNQLSDSERLKYADYVIKNEEPMLLTPQVELILNELNYSSSSSSSSSL